MPSGVAVVKGCPQADLAFAYVDMLLGAELQQRLVGPTFSLPTNRAVPRPAGLPADLVVHQIDWATVARERDGWIKRWDREMGSEARHVGIPLVRSRLPGDHRGREKLRRQRGARRGRPRRGTRRVRLAARPLRLREDDPAAHRRRPRVSRSRPGRARRARHHPYPAASARHRGGVPELRPVPPPHGRRERRLRAQGQGASPGRDRRHRLALPRPGPDGALRRPPRAGAVGRAAAAGGGGARAGRPAEAPASRRAVLGPRPQAQGGDADRPQAPPAGTRHHRPVRHPRPGRGAHHVRPDRGDEPRRDRAARRPGDALPPARHRLRARLRRPVDPDSRPRAGGGGRDAAGRDAARDGAGTRPLPAREPRAPRRAAGADPDRWRRTEHDRGRARRGRLPGRPRPPVLRRPGRNRTLLAEAPEIPAGAAPGARLRLSWAIEDTLVFPAEPALREAA